MHRWTWNAAGTSLLLAAGLAHAQLGFEIETSPYFLPQPPYMEGQRITGRFELEGPLPTWEADFDLRDRLVDFEFDDGVATRTFADSEVCEFRATIDARGQLIDWVLDVRQRPLPPAGQEQHILRMTSGFSQSSFRAPGDAVCEEGFLPISALTLNMWLTPDEAPLPIPAATYWYASAPFRDVQPPYTVGDSFLAYLRFAGPIPPLRSNFDLAPFVEESIVQDPVTGARSSLSSCFMRVSTDANGQIIDWSMVLTRFMPIAPPPPNPRPTNPGWSLTPSRDSAQRGFSFTCPDGEILATSEGGGSWRGGPPEPVPTLGRGWLAVLAVLLLVLGLRRSRHAQSPSADR
jgi:hypothetical protein